MKQELENKLIEAFPNLYRQHDKSMMETCMCWGFECGDGWFNLLWELSEKLENLINKFKQENPEGYAPCATQVKEKFGTLRFYVNNDTDEMFNLISAAEDLSAVTCERCGKPGSERGPGWIMTLCDECNKKRYNRDIEKI